MHGAVTGAEVSLVSRCFAHMPSGLQYQWPLPLGAPTANSLQEMDDEFGESGLAPVLIWRMLPAQAPGQLFFGLNSIYQIQVNS